MKEQEKSPEKELNEMEASSYKCRIQNNDYKDGQGTQGKMNELSENLKRQ